MPPAPPRDLATATPLIAVEVLLPSSVAIDRGLKVESYFSLPSLAHYLILDPDRRALTLHRRTPESLAEPRLVREGAIRLDPPGLELAFNDLFGPAD